MLRRRETRSFGLLLALTGIALAGSAVATARVGRVSHERRPVSQVGVGAALRQSFATNGRVGFFVETSGKLTSGVDLYLTTWWIAAEPELRTKLDRGAVIAWARTMLSGGNPGANATQTPFSRVLLAARLLQSLGVRRPVPSIDRLSRLIEPGKTWAALIRTDGRSSTFVAEAVNAERLTTAEGLRAPAALSRYLDRLARHALGRKKEGSIGPEVAVLSAVSASFAHDRRAEIRHYLARAAARLRQAPLFARIAYESQLVDVASAVGLSWGDGKLCRVSDLRRLLARTADPQIRYDAGLLGCSVGALPPPYTPLGWPHFTETQNALFSTVDGMKVALAQHALAAFRRPIIRKLEKAWLPGARAQGRRLAMGDKLALRFLGHVLGVRVALPPPTSAEVELARTQWAQYLVLAPLERLEGKTPPAFNEDSLATLKQGLPVIAAMVIHEEQLTGASKNTARAVGLVKRAKSAGGIYFLVPPKSGAIWGTIGAHWALSKNLSPAVLRAHDLLLADGEFRDRFHGRTLGQPWLQVEATLVTVNQQIYPPIFSIDF